MVGDLNDAIRFPQFDTYNAWLAVTDEDQVRAAVSRGLEVNLWTVNEEADMRRFIAAGVTGLFTDWPQKLRAVLESLS